MTKKKTTQEFKNEVEKIYKGSVTVLGEYTGNKNKILVRFNECGHEEERLPTKLLLGRGCLKCVNKRISESKMNTKEEFIEKLLEKNLNDILVLSSYEGVKNKLKVLNNKCGHSYWAIASNILNGSGCPVCHGMKNTNQFIKLIDKKYPDTYKVLGEYINNRTPIKVMHKCGYEWEVIPKDLLHRERCPNCMKSYGEKFIADYLEANKIEFEEQYKFDMCRDVLPLPFDFKVVINGMIKLIEFDGEQHYLNYDGKFKGKTKEHDIIKNNFCKLNNIEVLRIPYWWLRNDRIIKELNKFIFNKCKETSK